ncbi:MAG: hypothetical protein FWE08_07380 [Oscillospiraceae bacterium]|nr:hypothetical protein [Oscillospiraceae bacterium]
MPIGTAQLSVLGRQPAKWSRGALPRIGKTSIEKNEYKALLPRKQKKYLAEHKTEQDLFKSANSYLNKHRNTAGKIPLAAWIKERDSLLKEKNEISKSTMSLSERLRQIDCIRKRARESMPKQSQRNRGWEMEH